MLLDPVAFWVSFPFCFICLKFFAYFKLQTSRLHSKLGGSGGRAFSSSVYVFLSGNKSSAWRPPDFSLYFMSWKRFHGCTSHWRSWTCSDTGVRWAQLSDVHLDIPHTAIPHTHGDSDGKKGRGVVGQAINKVYHIHLIPSRRSESVRTKRGASFSLTYLMPGKLIIL